MTRLNANQTKCMDTAIRAMDKADVRICILQTHENGICMYGVDYQDATHMTATIGICDDPPTARAALEVWRVADAVDGAATCDVQIDTTTKDIQCMINGEQMYASAADAFKGNIHKAHEIYNDPDSVLKHHTESAITVTVKTTDLKRETNYIRRIDGGRFTVHSGPDRLQMSARGDTQELDTCIPWTTHQGGRPTCTYGAALCDMFQVVQAFKACRITYDTDRPMRVEFSGGPAVATLRVLLAPIIQP